MAATARSDMAGAVPVASGRGAAKKAFGQSRAEVLVKAMIPRIRAAGPPVRRLDNALHALASLPVEVEPA